jgi:Major Facilitator Superfamily
MSHAWLVTFLAVWWAVGYTVTGLLAWWFMSDYSCAVDATVAECTNADNMGWRYLHITCGGLVLIMSVLRLVLVRMVQTPKWLVSQNRDEELFQVLLGMSEKYRRPFSLTLEKLQSQGRVLHTEKSVWSGLRLKKHFSGLFSTRKLAYSTVMIIVNWLLIGTVSPLYSVFLPYYLESRGADTGSSSNYTTWRNYAINQIAGLLGPIIAGVLVETRYFGRRGTLAVGAAMTTALQLGYTQIKTPAQNLGVSAAITAASNIYYGTIYAYTPEILPSAHRATGYGLCVVLNRVGGIIGVLIGSYTNVTTTTPLWVCAGLYGALIFTSLLLPFESMGKRTV